MFLAGVVAVCQFTAPADKAELVRRVLVSVCPPCFVCRRLALPRLMYIVDVAASDTWPAAL